MIYLFLSSCMWKTARRDSPTASLTRVPKFRVFREVHLLEMCTIRDPNGQAAQESQILGAHLASS